MDISAAALPPRQPYTSDADKAHPLFAEYRRYVSGMSFKLLEADSFRGWLNQRELQAELEDWSRHPRFKEFQRWMFATKAGARPAHGMFPENFKAWLNGARW